VFALGFILTRRGFAAPGIALRALAARRDWLWLGSVNLRFAVSYPALALPCLAQAAMRGPVPR